MDLKTQKILVIQGGPSIEREISLITSRNVIQALQKLNFSFTVYEADDHLYTKLQELKPDRAFLAVHGPYGEDGTLQGLLEYLQIPYTGSGVLASSLCMDKAISKKWMTLHQIPTTEFINLYKKENSFHVDLSNWNKTEILSSAFLNLKNSSHDSDKSLNRDKISEPPFLPCVVKPNRSGSSIGISICRSPKEWTTALELAFKIDTCLLIEPYIKGQELAVSWLGDHTLTPIEISPKKDHFYDFKRKYEKNQTEYFIPARVESDIIEKLRDYTSRIQKIFKIRSYCRADFIIDKNSQIYALEVNTLPGLTPLSLLPKSAQYDGISYNQLICKLLTDANLDYLETKKNEES